MRTAVRHTPSTKSLRQAFGQAFRPGHKKQASTSSNSTASSSTGSRRHPSPPPVPPMPAMWPVVQRPVSPIEMPPHIHAPAAQMHAAPRAPVGRVPRQAHPAAPVRAPSPHSFLFDETTPAVRGAYTHPPMEDVQMVDIQPALTYVLQNEGQGFVWVEDDHGGPTKMGVTQGTLTRWLGRPATVDDVRNLTADTVQAIYNAYYWTPVKAAQMPYQSAATALLDIAVLTGTATAVRLLQAAVGTTQDGVIGPVTLAACAARTEAVLVGDFSQKACSFFAQIALKDATQAKFLPGWMVRAHKMLRLVVH